MPTYTPTVDLTKLIPTIKPIVVLLKPLLDPPDGASVWLSRSVVPKGFFGESNAEELCSSYCLTLLKDRPKTHKLFSKRKESGINLE